MANVLFSRTDSPSTKPITDGQIIFDTSGNGKMYLDNGTTRLEMGGAIDVDTTLDATSTNPIQNKGVAGVMLSELEEIRGTTKKGFLTDALATKTLDAKITEVNGKLTIALPSESSIHSLDNKIRIAEYKGGLVIQLSIDQSKNWYVMLSFDQTGLSYIKNDSDGYVSKKIV